ncbi:glycoside hydrolase family 97 C-terminal domain-containing protein [Hymenobacter glacieicola]|uniref:Glycosyl-hydrolase 97 C-terminal oligomerisation domain-containing protein n=1 Tax=Hymenobacter glacieicola TaxID=1562124 RepID=A0ABQ1WM11_9BACT|nr:glycoside hydrolase family 97 C-terminal domain-containing protein [Hymenobacter glacieicola]GGG33619.1 hypothetical protein GCM10011378_07590 [Hymenobacter glacieicola]
MARRPRRHDFELDLSVLFQSGIQYYVETPAGMAAQPTYVQESLRQLSPRWADVRLFDGFPGQYAVLARQAPDKRWYVASINGTDQPKTL